MRTSILGLVLALSASAAVAEQPQSATTAATDAAAVSSVRAGARTLYICETDALTRRAFAREFGSVEFVTAEKAKAATGAWSSPKCISDAEARRLRNQLASR